MKRQTWAVALGVCGLIATAAPAQQPISSGSSDPGRTVYVVGRDKDNPKVYSVTGVTQAPVVPISQPPTTLPPTTSVEDSTPPAIVDAATATNCSTERCGKSGKCGKCGFEDCLSCMLAPATVPPPLGYTVREAFGMQRTNALGEYFVVYREDWLQGRPLLNDTGARHVAGIIRRLGMIKAPLKVEPTGNEELDARRKVALIELLVDAGVPPADASARIIPGATRAEGLRFKDIEAIYNSTGGTTGTINMGGGYGGYGGFGGMGGFGGGGVIGGFGGYGGIGGFR
jgi:hypothetical protein